MTDKLRENLGKALECELRELLRTKEAPYMDLAEACQSAARAALAAAPQPAPEQGMTRAEVGQMLDTKRHDREVLVEVINAAMDGRELVDGEPWGAEAIADALLAAGWTRGGDAAGLRRDDAG